MKTTKIIDGLIAADEKHLSDNLKTLTERQFNSIQNKIEFYKYIQKYLQFEPSEEFCVSELKRLQDQQERTLARFERWVADVAPKDVDPKEYKSIFNRETGLTKVNKQIKTLKFILEEHVDKPRKQPKKKAA